VTRGDTLNLDLARERTRIEKRLKVILARQQGIPRRLRSAMHHSLFGGGKRLRPILLLWTYDTFRAAGKREPRAGRPVALNTACALEMIHTYSLIHDDLPAMDDDVLRRGRPTCHVAFDEATAILAGDGLHALAFGLLASNGRSAPYLGDLVAAAVGPAGMVGGQHEDLAAEGQTVSTRKVRQIHRDKTAKLLAASLAAGAWLAGEGTRNLQRIQAAGINIGLAFQGADDLLDLTSSAEVLGKSVGKDMAAGKATFIRIEGVDKAKLRTARYGRQGLTQLRDCLPANRQADRLLCLVKRLWQRER
jgi:geranylgeranyl pyrophosphate synthase